MASRAGSLQCRFALVFSVLAFPLFADDARAQGQPKGAEVVPLVPHTGTVTSVAFSPDGTRVLSGS